MTNVAPKTKSSEAEQLRSTIFSILDAKIKLADAQLSNFANSILKEGQTPTRADQNNMAVALANENVFSFIENSSLHTTKLLYLRANLTRWNSRKILYMLTQKLVKSMSLEEIKREIN